MPLSVQQLNALGTPRLLLRLCNRYQHFLAFRIADYINVSPDSIYSHFAYCLISSNLSPQIILEKLKGVGSNVDYVELASLSFEIGKKEVGNFLLQQNPVKSRCVPLYLKQGQWNEAVEAAVQSQDTALLVFVLETVKKAGFQNLIENCLTKYKSALYAWLSLVPNEADKIDILLKYEKKQDALMIQFDEGRRLGGKKLDAIKNDSWAVNTFLKAKEFLQKIGKPEWINSPPIQVYSILLEQNHSSVKDAESAFGLSKTEILWSKIELFAKNGNDIIAKDIISRAKEEDLEQIFGYLKDLKKTNLFPNLIIYIKDEEIKNILIEKFNIRS